jgi:hypothetical protein
MDDVFSNFVSPIAQRSRNDEAINLSFSFNELNVKKIRAWLLGAEHPKVGERIAMPKWGRVHREFFILYY